MNDEIITKLNDQLDEVFFPWPEIREYMNAMVNLILAKQSQMVGEKMLEHAKDKATLNEVNVQLREVNEMLRGLQTLVESRNAEVIAGLTRWSEQRPRLILRH